HPGAVVRPGGRAHRSPGQGAGRPRATAPAVAGGIASGRRGLRVRPPRRLRPLPTHHQPPPEGAPRGRSPRPDQAWRVGLLLDQARRADRPRGSHRRLGGTGMTKPTVLFVCVHNAGRSQMAAGYLQHLAGDRIEVLSAGSEPADQVNPVAVEAMREEGIDVTGERPKVLSTEAVQQSDVVVTMGCGDACPFYPGKR